LRIPYETPSVHGREFIALAPEVVAAILRTLAGGWQHASAAADVNADAGEVLMTERLRDGMRNVLKNSRWKQMIVLPGTESRSKSSVMLPDGRTDIPLMLIEVFLRTQEHDPHAIIECKRIAGTDTRLCREYIIEGVDRFTDGKYGENHAVGFMVGYVLFGTPAVAAHGVNTYLLRVSRNAECLEQVTIIDFPTWYSRHARTKPLSPIYLHHTFLGVAGVAKDEILVSPIF